jgi:hypothetical protein
MGLDVNLISRTVPQKPGRKFALVYRHILRNQMQCSRQRKLKLKISIGRNGKKYDNLSIYFKKLNVRIYFILQSNLFLSML